MVPRSQRFASQDIFGSQKEEEERVGHLIEIQKRNTMPPKP